MSSDEKTYSRDQLRFWGFILEEWLQVRDRYSIIPPTMDKKNASKMIEARRIAEELVEKLKQGKSSVMKDPDDIDPLEDMKFGYQ